jgi:Mannosyltransferase (PIG-V)
VSASPLSTTQVGAGQLAAQAPEYAGKAPDLDLPPSRPAAPPEQLGPAPGSTIWPVIMYAASRLLLLGVAGLVAIVGQHAIRPEFFLFDAQWYLRLAEHGYPTVPLHIKSTLGFFPLYPLVIRAVAVAFVISAPQAALITSVTGGLVAAVLVHRLVTSWWGEATGRWATAIFCLFPGSIVFSMGYSECLTIPLAVGCLLALRSRRWWVAGILAGLATASEPVALVLIVVCLAASAQQLRSRGWRDPAARRSIVAPLLSPLGIGGFAVFLWAWTGTPFATYLAQHYGWHEQSNPFSLLTLPVVRGARSSDLINYVFTWNIWDGVLGAIFLVVSIVVLVRLRRELSTGTLVYTVGLAAVTLWSVLTPPNARMLLVAFPAVIIWGRRLSGRARAAFITVEVLVLIFTSALTFSGRMLPLWVLAGRPRPPNRATGRITSQASAITA